MKLTEIDTNFNVINKIERNDIEWHEVTEKEFSIYGLYQDAIYNKDKPEFMRMPKEIADKVNDGVSALNKNTAGGRLRFITDSPYIAIRHCGTPTNFPHMPLTGTSSFDIYVSENGLPKFKGCFVSPSDFCNNKFEYESDKELGEKKERDITINFPLYSDVDSLQIGIVKDSVLKKSLEYGIKTPIVFYGSSITQGACATRAGNTYQGFLSRKFDFDYINLGFSGSAKGEQIMADYINTLDMSAFVFDYDHNAPDAEHLRKTHFKFYEKIRDKHPCLPIIFMSMPTFEDNSWADNRRNVIEESFDKAKKNGDKNLYYINGNTLFGDDARDCCSVDGIHPNDLGFYRMAKALEPIFEKFAGILIYKKEST